MWKQLGAAALTAGMLSGCSIGTDLPLTQSAITTFHQQLNAADYASIYSGASQDMKSTATQDEFMKLLDAIHRKLGNFQSGENDGWRDNFNTSGHFLSIQFKAKYDKGDAEEDFAFRIDGGKALLAGYHVSSNALLED